MSKNLYEKYFTTEQLNAMKASSIRDLKDLEERATVMMMFVYITGFLEVIVIIAGFLWLNKFTLFLAIVGMLFVGLFALLTTFNLKSFKEKIKSVKEEVQ